MSAKVLLPLVKVVLNRDQKFGPAGQRPNTRQHIRLAASADGKLIATQHDVLMYTSRFADFVEGAARQTDILYDSENLCTSHNLVELNLGMGTFQRAPGEATGTV